MKLRKLGASDLMVSEISLGSWLTYGVGVEREKAASCVARAFELGINFIDTANAYGRGEAAHIRERESETWRSGGYGFWTVVVNATEDRLAVRCSKEGPAQPAPESLTLLFPANEARPVRAVVRRVASDRVEAGWRVVVVDLTDR